MWFVIQSLKKKVLPSTTLINFDDIIILNERNHLEKYRWDIQEYNSHGDRRWNGDCKRLEMREILDGGDVTEPDT